MRHLREEAYSWTDLVITQRSDLLTLIFLEVGSCCRLVVDLGHLKGGG